MGRGLLGAAIVATLVATTVAVGAGTDVRLHRLHVPPPPSVDASESAPPPAPSKPAPPAPPGTVAPPAAPSPPGSVPPPPAGPPPPPPPPPPAGVGCTAGGGGTPGNEPGTHSDFQVPLAPTAVAAAATLRFRGVNTPGSSTHNLSLRDSGNTRLSGTPNPTAGTAETFIVTNLPPGGYELYCTIHPGSMHEALTVS